MKPKMQVKDAQAWAEALRYCKAKGVPFYGLEWPSVVVS